MVAPVVVNSIDSAGLPQAVSPTDPMPAGLWVYNGTTWDQVLTEDDALVISAGKTGLVATTSRLYGRFAGGSTWQPLNLMNAADAVALGHGLSTLSGAMGYIGGGYWDRLRTLTTFNSGKFTAAGSSVIWTPAAGKKFRLMRIQVDVTGGVTAAAAADLDIVCYDGATALPVALSAYIPAAVTGNSWSSGWIELGNGILSVAADNVLNINLSFALTAGVVRVTVAGTDE